MEELVRSEIQFISQLISDRTKQYEELLLKNENSIECNTELPSFFRERIAYCIELNKKFTKI